MTSEPPESAREEVEQFVDEHRERIERIAVSDLPVAKYYQRVLDYVEGE